MYQLQEKADVTVVLENGVERCPMATLKDEYGGISHIIQDDRCFVLVNGSNEGGFVAVKHWFLEAAEALVKILNE